MFLLSDPSPTTLPRVLPSGRAVLSVAPTEFSHAGHLLVVLVGVVLVGAVLWVALWRRDGREMGR